MFVGEKTSVIRMLGWQWRWVTLLALAPILANIAENLWHEPLTELPAIPMSVVGGAIGIFASFRTKAAYDRWWEGRKLWGGLVNVSRHFASQVVAYVPDKKQQQRLVRRHAGYVHVLRCALRDQDPFADPEVRRLLGGELPKLRSESNLNHALLDRQMHELAHAGDSGAVSEQRLMSLDASLRVTLDVQGGCERIKRTPMPHIYAFVTTRLVVVYGLVFPLAIVHSLGWWSVPMNILVGLSFGLISDTGRVLEDPFTTTSHSLPLSSLCNTIERNILQRAGVEELPSKSAPTGGVLM